MNLEPFHLVEFQNPSGATVFRLDGKDKDGKRIRQNFKTQSEALLKKQHYEAELASLPLTPRVATQLSDAQVREAESAFTQLAGKSLSVAVRFYLENYREPVQRVTLSVALEEFLAAKQAGNVRPLTVQNLKTRVGLLSAAHGDKFVSDIQPDDLKTIITRPGRGAVTANNDRRAISSFFSWATEKGYCGANPAEKLKPIKVDHDEPQILPLESIRKLLSAAQTFKDGALVPYLALGLFCAIRPKELERLTWDNIDLESQTVTIGAKMAKMRSRRIVDISDNCLEWLLPHAAKRTPIKGKNWRRDFDQIKAAVGYGTPNEKRPELKPWIQDLMRHTGISNHLVTHENEGKTAAWAGNSPNIIQKHYKGLVTKKQAAEFWAISPVSSEGKILKMA